MDEDPEETAELDVEPTCTVLELKERIVADSGASLDECRLSLGDKCLEDSGTLSSQGVTAGAIIRIRLPASESPRTVFDACRDGDIDALRALLSGSDRAGAVEASTGSTALWIACWTGNVECARVLIDAGADLNHVNAMHDGWTPLCVACAQGNADCVALLAERGATVDLAEAGGMTPLAIAARKGDADLVRMLLSLGADPNSVSLHNRTPLHAACRCNHRAVAALLLEGGADPLVRSRCDTTAADVARDAAFRTPDTELADAVDLAATDRTTAVETLKRLIAQEWRRMNGGKEKETS